MKETRDPEVELPPSTSMANGLLPITEQLGARPPRRTTCEPTGSSPIITPTVPVFRGMGTAAPSSMLIVYPSASRSALIPIVEITRRIDPVVGAVDSRPQANVDAAARPIRK